MAKYVLVDQAPAELRKEEYLIEMPTFLEEVLEHKAKTPRGGLVGINHLRNIVGSIGAKYDQTLTAWNIRPVLYEGRRYSSDQELASIVVELLRTQHPSVFQGYIDAKIKMRPHGTKVVYFTGPFEYTTAFVRNGIDALDAKDVDVFLGLKAKKVVGKPALTDEERAAKKTTNE